MKRPLRLSALEEQRLLEKRAEAAKWRNETAERLRFVNKLACRKGGEAGGRRKKPPVSLPKLQCLEGSQ